VWKDVVGENLDFKIAIPNWKDLPDALKSDLQELEANIMNAVGPAFKVVEENIKDKVVKKQFVNY